MNDFETGWSRQEILLLNLTLSIAFEECPEKKKEYQSIIDEIIANNKKAMDKYKETE